MRDTVYFTLPMNTLSQPIMRGESVYQSTERHATGGMLMVPEEKNN
ncbi:hypothetical protein [Phocaeicola vulgatus]